jgi:hypothetical protein
MDELARGEFGLPTLDSLSMLEWETAPDKPNIMIPKTPKSPT